MLELVSDGLAWISSLRPAQWTEFTTAALASYAITLGIGGTALRGYRRAECQLPRAFVWHVNTVLSIAMLLRIATFVLDEKYYWFFIALDGVGFILGMIILGQSYGYFLRRRPVAEPAR